MAQVGLHISQLMVQVVQLALNREESIIYLALVVPLVITSGCATPKYFSGGFATPTYYSQLVSQI